MEDLSLISHGRQRYPNIVRILFFADESKYPELCAASYNKSTLKVNEPQGVALIWNMYLEAAPEFIFHTESELTSLCFSPFHPNLLIGGSYSGQIVMWDTRAKSHPVLKSWPTKGGHSHPVYCLQTVGTQQANSLISASTDGTVCTWSFDILAAPQDTLQLTKQQSRTNEVSITAMDFLANDATTFLVGTEEGKIYQGNRLERSDGQSGLSDVVYAGHSASVSGLHCHPSGGEVDFGDLFLSSGCDWNVSLWRSKVRSKHDNTIQELNLRNLQSKPNSIGASYERLCNFGESDDVVWDVSWSPSHPSLFATACGTGRLDVWNIAADTEVYNALYQTLSDVTYTG